jgi:hypothetical protein
MLPEDFLSKCSDLDFLSLRASRFEGLKDSYRRISGEKYIFSDLVGFN